MKKIILALTLLFSLNTFLIRSNEGSIGEELILDERTIQITSNQLDFLFEYNNTSSEKKWYVVVLGKDERYIENLINNTYEYLDVSNSSYSFDKSFLTKINDILTKTNKEKDYASYAVITDSGTKIVIPTTPINSKRMGPFLDELEKRLITAGNEDIPLQTDQRNNFKDLERKLRNSTDYKSKFIRDAVNEIYDKATKFKTSSKKYKILHYSIITPLNFAKKGTIQNEGFTTDDITTIDAKVHGTRYFSPKNDPLKVDKNIVRAFKNTYYQSTSEYQEYEKLMLARVSAYQQFIEGKDVKVDGLKEGFGKKVYITQQNKVKTDEEKEELLVLCNFLSDQYSKQTVSEKYEAIVDIKTVNYGKDRTNLLEAIVKNDILTKNELLDVYPYYGVVRQYNDGLNAFRVYFSNVHLWTKNGDLNSEEVFSEDYNSKSTDHLVANNTPDKSEYRYYYSLRDLVARYKCLTANDGSNQTISREILRLESEGLAHSVAQGEFYDQYVAMFGTDDAYLFIAYWAAQYARDLLGPYFLRQIIAEYGAMLTGKLLKDKATEVFIAMNIEILTQIFMNYYFVEATQYNIEKSVDNINKLDVIYSGSKSLIGLTLKQEIVLDCFKGALLDADYNITGKIDYKNCAKGTAIAVLQRYAGNHVLSLTKTLKKVARENPELFVKGWKQIFKDVGVDQSKVLRENIREIFDELKIPKTQKIKDFLDEYSGSGSNNNTSDTDGNNNTDGNDNNTDGGNNDADGNNNNTDADSDGNSNTDTDGNNNNTDTDGNNNNTDADGNNNNGDGDGNNNDADGNNSNDSDGTNTSSNGQKVDAEGSTTNNFDNVNQNAINTPEVEAEIVVTNSGVTDETKKLWQNHEMNVSKHLGDNFGNVNVGRQITVDIKIKKPNGEIVEKTLRIDNLVYNGQGKPFQIIDAKSSVTKELNTFNSSKLATQTSTKNQKWFYKALKESGNEITIKPRGQRAEDFFRNIGELVNGVSLPNSISFNKTIDFYTTSKIIDGVYDMFRIVY